jgi:hypothetical protein
LTLFYNHINTSIPGTNRLIDCIEVDLRNNLTNDLLTIYIDTYDSSLGQKWLTALNQLIRNNYHLEKNYCFLGFTESRRGVEYILNQINQSIQAINDANLGYTIDDYFSIENTIYPGPPGAMGLNNPGMTIVADKFNHLHRYFEDLQGTSGHMSSYYTRADGVTRWHIRQLNLLCHEFESLVLSLRKSVQAPEWRRPSQLMCWLNAPRFVLDQEDFELFGIETINRPLGGVFVGVNKAVGKHHWEVFCDEGRDITELVTTTLKSQTEAAGDFDIEWANNPAGFDWQIKKLEDFRHWLVSNGFDPNDKSLTIGHPQVGQVDLQRSFGTSDYQAIWKQLGDHLDVYNIRTSDAQATYTYNWDDANYIDQQVQRIQQGT